MTDRLWKVITNVTLAFGGLFRIQQIGNVCWWMILNMHLESINWEYVVAWIFYYFGSKEIFKIKLLLLGKGSCQKKRFFWEIFPKCGWVGWLIPKQGPNPSKPPQIAFFDPNFTFRFPKSHKNPGVGGWGGKQIWERYPKKNSFFWQPP